MSDETTITTTSGFWIDNERADVGDKIFVTGIRGHSFWQKVWSLIRWHYWPKDQNGEYVITSTTTATKFRRQAEQRAKEKQ